ncbi:MAG: alpha-amylase [Clostridium sp.]|nr:alpha-amylase [Clostridium sp.]
MEKWYEQSIFYHIYPLGFCDAPKVNKESKSTNRIKKIIEWIPHLKKISINAVYLGPVFESSEHGYDTKDYFEIDKRLGNNDDFKVVCDELHRNGIKVVLDGVFNHVGREFKYFQDVKVNRDKSKYINWFQNINFYSNSPYNDGFSYDGWNGHYNLVKLNIKNNEVKEYIFKVIDTWIDEFDIDGLRLDAADYMDREFFKDLRWHCDKKKEDFWLMGEVIHGDYNLWANKSMLNTTTNYECYKGIYSAHNDKNYFEIIHSINRQKGNYGIYKDLVLYNFVDNHDVTRISSILKKKECLENVYTLLFTMPGIPSIYYGSEWGIEGVKQKNSDYNLRPSLDINNIISNNKEIVSHIEKLGKIRRALKPLNFGNFNEIIIRNQQVLYKRSYNNEEVFIALNISDNDYEFEFNTKYAKFKDILNNKEIHNNYGKCKILVKPYKGAILIKD